MLVTFFCCLSRVCFRSISTYLRVVYFPISVSLSYVPTVFAVTTRFSREMCCLIVWLYASWVPTSASALPTVHRTTHLVNSLLRLRPHCSRCRVSYKHTLTIPRITILLNLMGYNYTSKRTPLKKHKTYSFGESTTKRNKTYDRERLYRMSEMKKKNQPNSKGREIERAYTTTRKPDANEHRTSSMFGLARMWASSVSYDFRPQLFPAIRYVVRVPMKVVKNCRVCAFVRDFFLKYFSRICQ